VTTKLGTQFTDYDCPDCQSPIWVELEATDPESPYDGGRAVVVDVRVTGLFCSYCGRDFMTKEVVPNRPDL